MGRGLVSGAAAAGAIALACTVEVGVAHAKPPGAAHPDLTGVWTNAWYTQVERPKDFKTLVVTPQAAEAYEAPRRALSGSLPSRAGALGQPETEFMDQGPGLARIKGQIRSSWIVDPADGQIPWKPGAKERLEAAERAGAQSSDIHARHTDDRCLTVTGAAAPMVNSPEGNVLTIVETPGAVILAGEKNHEYRIVRLGAATKLPPDPPNRLGSSTGWWAGKTLVITTIGWPAGSVIDMHYGISLTGSAKVIERLTRTGPAEITYFFEVDDPELYTHPWRAEMVFRPSKPMYEFACHEGNYAITGILNAARMAEEARSEATLKPHSTNGTSADPP